MAPSLIRTIVLVGYGGRSPCLLTDAARYDLSLPTVPQSLCAPHLGEWIVQFVYLAAVLFICFGYLNVQDNRILQNRRKRGFSRRHLRKSDNANLRKAEKFCGTWLLHTRQPSSQKVASSAPNVDCFRHWRKLRQKRSSGCRYRTLAHERALNLIRLVAATSDFYRAQLFGLAYAALLIWDDKNICTIALGLTLFLYLVLQCHAFN
jgi:hypothetical protein